MNVNKANHASLTQDIASLKGVGPKVAELLSQLHIYTKQDLLFHLPIRYEDRSRIASIASLKPKDRVLIEGRIDCVQVMGRRSYVKCELVDAFGKSLDLIFYHMTSLHYKKLKLWHEKIVRCFGEVRVGFSGHLEMVHPEYALISQIKEKDTLSLSNTLLPIYPTTKGLSQTVLRKITWQVIQQLSADSPLPELLPVELCQQNQWMSLNAALEFVHFPPVSVNVAALLSSDHPAQRRLILEELMAHQLGLQQLRAHTRSRRAMTLPASKKLSELLAEKLPFALTQAQRRVIHEINSDLQKEEPMLRLVQGDVGSGKTIVACFAALNAIEAGYQVALMAPTEILCEQHVANFKKWLSPLGVSVDSLLGKQTTTEQADIKSRLASGEIQLVIGTHALFQTEVIFQKLALLIIDEQHRFGVKQRLSLMEKGLCTGFFPHQLIMTATPIPRTLAMTAYVDLDCSVIDELPPGRKPISTLLISAEKRAEVIARVKINCELKKQAYWVCTLIDESDVLQCQAAETIAQQLQETLTTLRVGLVHGRLKEDEKNATMSAFARGELDVLVATTVIEVGVDVPNASLMVIENPERLGLAQLHQLRGRVGRGDVDSFCVLLYQAPLSEVAKKRLSVMRETQDGFVIAETDLQMRGPGDVLGAKQSGMLQLRVADLIRDQQLLPEVQKASQLLLRDHPENIPLLIERWIGEEVQYLYS